MTAVRRSGLTRLLPFALLGAAACASDATGPGGDVDPLVLQWPVPGVEGRDWVINNYVDLDPGSGLRDYRGGVKTYEGHRGVDIDVPNFRWMDGDHPIVAAHAGEAVALHGAQPDRNTSCLGSWNFVRIRHDDGSVMIYGHLKRNSITVGVGQRVEAGEVLGVVGSSGCSTQPHLHLELLDANAAVVDPFQEGLWASAPTYDPPLDFMDLSVKNGPISGLDELKDPLPNATAVTLGGTLGVGLSMSGGATGDVVRVTVEDGGGSLVYDLRTTFSQTYRHSYWYWNRAPVQGAPGSWTLRVHAAGDVRATYSLTVE